MISEEEFELTKKTHLDAVRTLQKKIDVLELKVKKLEKEAFEDAKYMAWQSSTIADSQDYYNCGEL